MFEFTSITIDKKKRSQKWDWVTFLALKRDRDWASASGRTASAARPVGEEQCCSWRVREPPSSCGGISGNFPLLWRCSRYQHRKESSSCSFLLATRSLLRKSLRTSWYLCWYSSSSCFRLPIRISASFWFLTTASLTPPASLIFSRKAQDWLFHHHRYHDHHRHHPRSHDSRYSHTDNASGVMTHISTSNQSFGWDASLDTRTQDL